MILFRPAVLATLTVAALCAPAAPIPSAAAAPAPVVAKARAFSVFASYRYTLIQPIDEWVLSTPSSTLELRIRVRPTSAPTEVFIRKQWHTVQGGTTGKFFTNKLFGQRPFRTPFRIKIPDERNRTSGWIKFAK